MKGLQELVKHGFVERAGNAYRITGNVNIQDLQDRLRRRTDLIT